MVICLNLGRPKLSFLFAKLSFGMNVKGQRNPSNNGQPREAGKTVHNDPLNGNYHQH